MLWCLSVQAYGDMQRNIPDIHFVKGVPSDLEFMINPSKRNLVVIDDLMQELSNDPRITSLFTKGCHRRMLFLLYKTFFIGAKN